MGKTVDATDFIVKDAQRTIDQIRSILRMGPSLAPPAMLMTIAELVKPVTGDILAGGAA